MWGRYALNRSRMEQREPEGVPDQLQRRIQGFLADAVAARAIFDAGKRVFLGTSVGKVREKNEDRAIVVQARYAGNQKGISCLPP
jgi:hypothetical protein